MAKDLIQFKNGGILLYFGMPMCLFTGTYRLTARKQFLKEVVLGFAIDIVYLLAMSYLQGVNNATLAQENIQLNANLFEFSKLQTIAFIVKLVCFAMWPLEIFIFVIEMCRKQNLEHAPI